MGLYERPAAERPGRGGGSAEGAPQREGVPRGDHVSRTLTSGTTEPGCRWKCGRVIAGGRAERSYDLSKQTEWSAAAAAHSGASRVSSGLSGPRGIGRTRSGQVRTGGIGWG